MKSLITYILVELLANKNTQFFHKNYLGSYDIITNNNGRVVERLSFDPWGRRRNPDTGVVGDYITGLFDRGYTGHQHLDAFTLINMNGRVFDPVIARFLSPDPFIQSPGYGQNYNRYTYALNNPLKYTDPSGYTHKPTFWKKNPVVEMNWAAIAGLSTGLVTGYDNFNKGAYLHSGQGVHYESNSGKYYDNDENEI